MFGTGGNTALKVIVVMGVLAFGLLLLVAVGLNKALKPNERERVSRAPAYTTPFDANRAFRDLEQIVGFGPRPPGSEAQAKLRAYVKREVAQAGLRVREHRFEAETPLGPREMVNVVAVVQGARPGIILLGNHYDTKHFEDFAFAGANDGGSSTAWMLEMARALGPSREGRSLWLVWFDGEEAFAERPATDGLYGSRAFVEHLHETGELEQVAAMINVDMIGDCYLRILRDGDAPDWLSNVVWEMAHRIGYRMHFSDMMLDVQGGHLPFRRAGVPSLAVIDFSYGGSPLEHRKNWHTANDTLDKVCPKSLQAVAGVIYHSLAGIEGYLDTAGGGRE